jgi:hypothetical protein
VDSNRVFGIYTAALVGGILSVITASVMAGMTAVPTFFTLVEHVSMSLLFRAAYKSFDVNYDVFAMFRGWRIERVTEAAAASGSMAHTA